MTETDILLALQDAATHTRPISSPTNQEWEAPPSRFSDTALGAPQPSREEFEQLFNAMK